MPFEPLQIPAAYSSAVLVAIILHISDFAFQLSQITAEYSSAILVAEFPFVWIFAHDLKLPIAERPSLRIRAEAPLLTASQGSETQGRDGTKLEEEPADFGRAFLKAGNSMGQTTAPPTAEGLR
jgi:hypothetical protein